MTTTKFDLSGLKSRLDDIASALGNKEARIGFPSNIQYEDGTSVAFVATIQNYGAPAASIPPRPFMGPAFEHNKDKWTKYLAKQVRQVARGEMDGTDALMNVGMIAALDVQQTIEDITEPPLSPVTLLLRDWRREGRTITGKTVGEAAKAIADGTVPKAANEPLTDTGFMLASLRYGVAKTGSEEDPDHALSSG